MCQQKNIIYRIWYLPFIAADRNPKYYCGSKYNYKGNYKGSLSSSLITDYTNGLSLKDWWKSEWKRDKSNFYFEILEFCDSSISPENLVLRELEWHNQLNVLSDEYFNQSLATKGFVSRIKTGPVGTATKHKQSVKTKEYWDSPEGQAKRERMKSRNKLPKNRKYLWELTSPNGEVIISNNLNASCKEHGLLVANMVTLAKGTTGSTHHKGWQCKKLK